MFILQKGKLRPSEGRAHLTQLSLEPGFLTRVAARPRPQSPASGPTLPMLPDRSSWGAARVALLPPTLSQVLPVTGGRQEASWPKYIVS